MAIGSPGGNGGASGSSGGSGGNGGSGDPGCVPACGSMECGLDPKCGKSCGSCDADGTCEAGSCVKHCTLEPFTADRTFDLDIEDVEVRGTLTARGQPLADNTNPNPSEPRAFVRFIPQGLPRNATTGVVGPTGPATYSVKLVPGTYDVVLYPGSYHPSLAVSAALVEHNVRIDADRTRDYDLAVVDTEFALTMDGVPLPETTASYGRGSLVFVSHAGGLRDVRDVFPMDAPVMKLRHYEDQIYDIWFWGQAPDGVVPQGYQKVRADWKPTTAPLTLDIKTARLQAQLTFNGAPWPERAGENEQRGPIRLRNLDGGPPVILSIPGLGESKIDIRLPLGRYEVSIAGNGIDFQIVEAELDVSSDVARTWDVATVRLTGKVTLRGATPPPDEVQFGPSPVTQGPVRYGTITFKNRHTGNQFSSQLRDEDVKVPPDDALYDVALTPGEYDVSASLEAPAGLGVSGLTAPLGRVVVDKTGVEDFDAHPLFLTTTVTIDGAQPSSSGQIMRGELFVRGLDPFLPANVLTPSAGRDRSVAALDPGRYMVEHKWSSPANPFPNAQRTLLSSSIDVRSDTTLPTDLHAITVSGTVTRNGQPLPDGDGVNSRGQVEAVSAVTGSIIRADIGSTGPAKYTMELAAGGYDFQVVLATDVPGPDERIQIGRGCSGDTIALEGCTAAPEDLTGTWHVSADFHRGFDEITFEHRDGKVHARYTDPKMHMQVETDGVLDSGFLMLEFPYRAACTGWMMLEVKSGCILRGLFESCEGTSGMYGVALYR